MKTTLAWVLTVGLALITTVAFAGDGEKGREGRRGEFTEDRAEKREAHREFMKSIRDLPDDQKLDAIKRHMLERHKELTAKARERQDAIIDRVKDKLAGHEGIPKDSASKFLAFMKAKMKENMEFRERMFDSAMAHVSRVFSDGSVSGDERRKAMKTFREDMRKKVRAHHEAQKSEREAKRKELFGDLKLGPEGRGGKRRGPEGDEDDQV